MKMLMQVLTLMMTVMVAVVSGSGVGFARHFKRDAVEGECGIGHFGGIFKSIYPSGVVTYVSFDD
jgi:hypothetical protein